MDQTPSTAPDHQVPADPIEDLSEDRAFRAALAEAAARAERQMRQLEEMAEIAFDVMRVLRARVTAPETAENQAALDKLTRGDIGQTLGRLGRMVRLSQALENRIAEELRIRLSLDRAAADKRLLERAAQAKAKEDRREERLAGLIERGIEDVIEQKADRGEIEPLKERLYEKLSEDEYFFSVGETATIELLGKLCRELDLPFDLADWQDMDWAQDAASSPGSRRAEPSAGTAPDLEPAPPAAKSSAYRRKGPPKPGGAAVPKPGDLLAGAAGILQQVEIALGRAEDQGDLRAVSTLAGQGLRASALLMRRVDALPPPKPSSYRTDPGWIAIRQTMFEALVPYPDVRRAVDDALQRLWDEEDDTS